MEGWRLRWGIEVSPVCFRKTFFLIWSYLVLRDRSHLTTTMWNFELSGIGEASNPNDKKWVA